MAAKCQGWWLAPEGAVAAASMQAVITASGTGRLEYWRTEWRRFM